MNFIRKHRKAVLIITAVSVILFAFFYWQRTLTMAKNVYDELKEEPREEAVTENDYYYSKLTSKEGEDYLFLKDKIENLEGGVLTLPQPINGKEYQRIMTALECDGGNYFYGFADIPMTEDNIFVLYENKDIMKITEEKITKVVLFLSCSQGIGLSGQFEEDGRVSNIEKIQEGLSINEEAKVTEIQNRLEETEKILDDIVNGIPEGSGKKATVEYFLTWLDENMEVKENAAATTENLQDMGDMLDKVYPYNHLAALTDQKASVLGYAKIFSELCRRAGIDSHVVMGNWNGRWLDSNMYVFCTAAINGQNIYIDASGNMEYSLGGKRWLTEKEARNRLNFADYFEYE